LRAMVLLKKIKNNYLIQFSLEDFFAAENLKQLAGAIDHILWLKSDVEMDNEMII